MVNNEKLKGFPLRSGTRQGWQLSPLLFKILEVITKVTRQLPLLENNIVIYIGNCKDCTKEKKNNLELISKSNSVGDYKVKIQKSKAFLYTSNKPLEEVIFKNFTLQ